jgi:hypothetical protein
MSDEPQMTSANWRIFVQWQPQDPEAVVIDVLRVGSTIVAEDVLPDRWPFEAPLDAKVFTGNTSIEVSWRLVPAFALTRLRVFLVPPSSKKTLVALDQKDAVRGQPYAGSKNIDLPT